MKKQWIAFLLMFVLLLSMAGCSSANAVQKLEVAEEVAEEKLDAVEDKLEERLQNAVTPTTLPAETGTATVVPETVPAPPAEPVAPQPQPAQNPGKLTEEEARQIALDYLGFRLDQVTRLRTEYEIDDGIPQYDLEFWQGDWEYEFEIHAENGKILSYDKDHKYD